MLTFVLIAACLGVLAGLGEGAVSWIFSVVPDRLGWKNDHVPQIFWIAPAVDLLLSVILAVLIAPLSRALPRLRPDLLAYAVFGWLAAYGPLSVSGRLHSVARLVLATGVAVLLCRLARARPPIAAGFLGRALAALSVLVAAVSTVGAAWLEPGGVATGASPAAAARGKANVLLITLDTLRADHVSAYGYARPTTPAIDRLAAEGVLFENAFSTASWTLPSHATIMTGRHSHEHGADGPPLDRRFPTLAEVLSGNGFATAAFVANTFFVTPGTGLLRGFEHSEVFYSSPADILIRTFYGRTVLGRLPLLGEYDIPGRKRAERVNQEFFRWLESNPRRPFFAFLNYLDVHDPYFPPAPNTAISGGRPDSGKINSYLIADLFKPLKKGKLNLSPEEIQQEIDGYDLCLMYLDARLDALFAGLADRGLLDDTVIILTSDHGESFGEHGLFGHGNSLYRDQIHVPLVIRHPGLVPRGARLRQPVSLQAIPATVVDLLGLGTASPFPGTSLARRWADRTAGATDDPGIALSESLPGLTRHAAYPLGRRGEVRSLVAAEWHWILHEEGTMELFRPDTDVREADDLAATSEGKRVIRDLVPKLAALLSPRDRYTFRVLLQE